VIDERGNPVSPQIVDPGGILDGESPAEAGKLAVYSPPRFGMFLSASNPLRCSAVTTNRAAHAAVGGFDASLRYVVDWEFWRRVALEWSVAWLGSPPTVAVRWHLGSETHRFKTATADLEETERLVDLILSDTEHPVPDPRGVRAKANRRLARAYLNRAYDAARSGQGSLTRTCLRKAMRLWPAVIGQIARDPRLLGRLLLGAAGRSR
jgi:hypothetical protein